MLLMLLAHSARLVFTLDLPPAASVLLQTPVQWMEYVNSSYTDMYSESTENFIPCI